MHHRPALWKANAIAFAGSSCVMVIELIAGRMLAPYIGVSLYTWTSIIGVVLAGVALGNYAGGRLADRYRSSSILVVTFFVGALATVAILPAIKTFAPAIWTEKAPVMLSFALKTFLIFFPPAFILSMVSPQVIRLTLVDLGRTGGIVGAIYAVSTAGSILGTFMTGFYLVPQFGTRMVVWLVAGVLVLTGLLAWSLWPVPDGRKRSLKHAATALVLAAVLALSAGIWRAPDRWQENYTRESSYFTIQIRTFGDEDGVYKALVLDHLIHSFVLPDSPTKLKYPYLKVFEEITRYIVRDGRPLRSLHLGGGGYSFPRYLEAVYPGTVNEVVEIDPAVTEVAHQELGLPADTTIKTYDQDARIFLIGRRATERYNIVVGDVFNDRSTPYHLTTVEFGRLVKANMEKDGVYLVNIIDDYRQGKYMASFIHTLRQVFDNVYLFRIPEERTMVILATDRRLDLEDYMKSVLSQGKEEPSGAPVNPLELENYLAAKDPILLTDDYVPTDILVASLTVRR
ncbi:MAG: fused MFS/spermidine synthase [Chloroflexi bacterium]|nr:fused MFS/spermidine synthase [Chloroflexota bacterium]